MKIQFRQYLHYRYMQYRQTMEGFNPLNIKGEENYRGWFYDPLSFMPWFKTY